MRTIEVHGDEAHGALPNTQPFDGDTKVTLAGRNPGGTGPPGGPWKAVGGGAATGLGDGACVVVGSGDDTTVVGAGTPMIRTTRSGDSCSK